MDLRAPVLAIVAAIAMAVTVAPPARADCLPEGCVTLTPDSGPPGTRVRGDAGVRCTDGPITLRLYLYAVEGWLDPPPPGSPWTQVRGRGVALGMEIRFTIPRLPPGRYQLALVCPAYSGEEGDVPAGVYPVSPDMLTITTRVPDSATDAGPSDAVQTVAWVVALVLGAMASAVRLRRPRREREAGDGRPEASG